MLILRKAAAGSQVAPLVGAWIEISAFGDLARFSQVAPLVGAWIEIQLKWRLQNE